MFDLTASEAAEKLGVGRSRVYQLIESGALSAEKVGGIWLVDSASVANRLEKPSSAGRPTHPASENGAGREYILMNRSHEVLAFKYVEGADEFLDSDEIYDASRAPLGLVSPRGAKASGSALAFWWRHRSIPQTRAGMAEKLRELGVDSPEKIPFRSLGLSLSDQYWIRPVGSDIRWEDVNFFDNAVFGHPSDDGWLSEVGLESPDNTSEGELSKRWIVRDGKRILVKGGSILGQEPFDEVLASTLHRRLLEPGEFVGYTLERQRGEAVCLCEDFITSEEEYLPAYYVFRIMRKPNHRSEYQHYVECCAELEVPDVEPILAKMIVCDDIIGNFDRHWRNFGLIRNVETHACRPAPLFDSGNSLWCRTPTARLRAGDVAFSTKPFYEDANRQLRLVNDYSWFDPKALEGFPAEVERTLAGEPALEDRAQPIAQAVQARIERIVRTL